MTPEELKELARRILNKEVFGTWDIAPHDFDNYVKLIFLPIAFGAEPPTNRFAAFAPYDEALPRGVGGYPCFGSVQFITEEDYGKLVKILVAAEKAQEEAIETSK